jgi:hypothetical protein
MEQELLGVLTPAEEAELRCLRQRVEELEEKRRRSLHTGGESAAGESDHEQRAGYGHSVWSCCSRCPHLGVAEWLGRLLHPHVLVRLDAVEAALDASKSELRAEHSAAMDAMRCEHAEAAGRLQAEQQRTQALTVEMGRMLTRLSVPKYSAISCTEAKTGGLTLMQLRAAGYTCAETSVTGYSLRDMRLAGYTCAEAKKAGYTCEEASIAGYTCTEVTQAGFMSSLKQASALKELKAMGYVEGLKAAGFYCREAWAAGYKLREMRIAGYDMHDFEGAGLSFGPRDFMATTYATCLEAKEQGFSPYECRQAGFAYADGKAAGFRGTESDWTISSKPW